jgi:PAS domain S-box-containing protein
MILMLTTGLTMAVLFGAIAYPFEIGRRKARLDQIEYLLRTVFEQKREPLANEIFADQTEALMRSISEIMRVEGIIGVKVYDAHGQTLISTLLGNTKGLTLEDINRLKGRVVFTQAHGPQGFTAEYSSVIEAIGEQVGFMTLYYDLSDLESETWATVSLFALLFLSVMLTMVLFTNLALTGWVIRPVSFLRDAMRQVQQGNYGGQIDLSAKDEIGQMAQAFNEMSSQLQKSDKALTEAIRSQDVYALKLEETNQELARLNADLESMVAARTAELTESNLQLTEEIEDRIRAEADLATEKERLAVTLSSIGDGVISTDTEGRIVLANKIALSLTGWTSWDILGQPVSRVFRIEDSGNRNGFRDPVIGVLDSGRIYSSTRNVLLADRSGEKRRVAYSVAPIRGDRDQRVIGAVLVFRDVTAQAIMEMEAQKSAKLESLGILAGGIAHDFNNIMTAILGNLSLARMHVSPGEKVYDKLVDAEKATLYARGLTRQLLTFSKGGDPIKTVTSVTEFLKDTVNFAMAGSKALCQVHLADGLWSADIDVTQINQVIHNLVINANQAMPEGGTITISTYNLKIAGPREHPPLEPGRYVVISVRDEGVGIHEELRDKIFDPYFTTKEKGSGLGLSTSYSVMKNHGGHIEVFSQPGKGTEFRLFLPAAGETASLETDQEETVVKGHGRILIMDDEEGILEVASEALNLLGYRVETARDGQQAIDIYEKALTAGQRFDAVVMDLTIPGGVGGLEVIKHLRKIDPDVRAVVSSGYSQDPIMADYKTFGFNDVLPKPYKLEELSQVLGRTIQPS